MIYVLPANKQLLEWFIINQVQCAHYQCVEADKLIKYLRYLNAFF